MGSLTTSQSKVRGIWGGGSMREGGVVGEPMSLGTSSGLFIYTSQAVGRWTNEGVEG